MSNSWHIVSPGGSSFDPDNFRVLELFSGIGCMHHAVDKVQSLVEKKVYVESVDINTSANVCYAQSFPASPPPHTFSLDCMTSMQLDSYRPEAIFLSPPCQPYTMTCNAVRRDEQDPRARSTIVLTECLSKMALPPRFIAMENVEGFVGSNVHQKLLKTLKDLGYELEQFLISPHQLGIPYFRARYFLLAQRIPEGPGEAGSTESSSALIRHPPPLPFETVQLLGLSRSFIGPQKWPPASFPGTSNLESITRDCTPLSSFLENDLRGEEWQQHSIPKEVLSKFYKCYDIITPSSRHCNCITKNYSINHRGSGSILLTAPLETLGLEEGQILEKDSRGRLYFTSDPSETPLYSHLRYLTRSEISRLHGLPSPHLLDDLSLKTGINLLGNSLSIDCFAWLLAHLFTSPVTPELEDR